MVMDMHRHSVSNCSINCKIESRCDDLQILNDPKQMIVIITCIEEGLKNFVIKMG